MIRTGWMAAARLAMALPLALACAAAAAQGDPAQTRRAVELRETPGESGRSLASLPAQAPLTRLDERQGPWVKVRIPAGATGWVHLFDVTLQGATESQGGSALRGVTSLFSRGGAQPMTSATSTIGVRGLGAEDLAKAQPNPAGVTQMEALRQSESEARAFAAEASLGSVPVEALPAPSRLRSSPGGDPSNPGQAQ